MPTVTAAEHNQHYHDADPSHHSMGGALVTCNLISLDSPAFITVNWSLEPGSNNRVAGLFQSLISASVSHCTKEQQLHLHAGQNEFKPDAALQQQPADVDNMRPCEELLTWLWEALGKQSTTCRTPLQTAQKDHIQSSSRGRQSWDLHSSSVYTSSPGEREVSVGNRRTSYL